ncbi:MAG: ABC transporter ATP-binding protein [Methylococcaceae bacterium]|nr:ABC transporter ATP-binding protein [Methylococcaceae bacterium]
MKHAWASYLGSVTSTDCHGVVAAIVLVLVVALTEGISVVLLLPILAHAGLDAGAGSGGGLSAEDVSRIFAMVGLAPTLSMLLAAFLVLSASHTVLARKQAVAMFTFEQSVAHAFRQRLYSAIVNAKWLAICRIPSADLIHALLDQVSRVGTGSYVLLMLAGDVAVGLIYVLLSASMSWVMTLFVLISGVLLVGLLQGSARKLHCSGQTIADTQSTLYAGTIEHMQSLKTAKTYSAHDRNRRFFSGLSADLADAYMKGARRQSSVGAAFEIGSTVVLCAALYGSIGLLRLPAARIMVLLLLFSRIMPRIMSAHQHYRNLTLMLPTFGQVAGIIERLEAEAEPASPAPQRICLRRHLQLQGVSFRYRPELRPAVHDLDLVIPAGKIVALVGPSGAGKSTVTDLVMGLLSPDRGSILLDGVALQAPDLTAWREQIGFVSQETVLFRMSLRENLLWANPYASPADIEAALRLSAADTFVNALPEGLDTVVGERGFRISEGERQRLALARALLRAPSLLVLDEATNSLDPDNESRILNAISHRSGMTVLLISHRMATIRWADLIYFIEAGTISEMGNWTSLITRPEGRFHDFCVAQGIGSSSEAAVPASRPESRWQDFHRGDE